MRMFSIFAAACVSANAVAQQPALQTVEPGVADVGALSVSFRDMKVDLRVPTGFQQVYRVPGPGQEDKFMRVSGALYAVFPQSQYIPTRVGMMAMVPAGTTYYIGPPPVAKPSQAPPPASVDQRVERHRDGRFDDFAALDIDEFIDQTTVAADSTEHLSAKPLPQPTRPIVPRTVATDENYRVKRVHQLLQRAAGVEMDRPLTPPSSSPASNQ